MTGHDIGRRRMLALGLGMLAGGCAPSRFNLVREPETGLMFGSWISKSVVMDPSFMPNKRIKVTLRNTSGDTSFDMTTFRGRIVDAYLAKGYEAAEGNDFGIKLDVNVVESSQIQADMIKEYRTIGRIAGGGIGAAAGLAVGGLEGAGVGIVSGAALGDILSRYVTEDTYRIAAILFIGIRDKARAPRKVVTFSQSVRVEDWEDDDFGKFRESHTFQLACYAGGTRVAQAEIAEQVRQRMARIAGDII